MPKAIYEQLFDHQKTGVHWLWELHQQEAGGIVAGTQTWFELTFRRDGARENDHNHRVSFRTGKQRQVRWPNFDSLPRFYFKPMGARVSLVVPEVPCLYLAYVILFGWLTTSKMQVEVLQDILQC